MTDSPFAGDRVSFSPKSTLRATIGSALASVGGRWEDVSGIVLHVPFGSLGPEGEAWEFDSDLALLRVPGGAVPGALDAEKDIPWDSGWAPGNRETTKFAATLWLPGTVLRFAPGFGIGEGVVCEAFSTAPPAEAAFALAGVARERRPGVPSHSVQDGLRVLRSIARQLGSEDDRDSERCIVEAVEIVEEALAAGIPGAAPTDGANPTYYLKEVWSARRSRDGTHLVPDQIVSGVGVSEHTFGASVDRDTRQSMESRGCIERGAAFFVADMPFRFVPPVEPTSPSGEGEVA